MTEDHTYECTVCGRESPSQWTVTKCEFRHTVAHVARKLGVGER